MMSARREALDEIEALQRLGVRLAIDDFGTGHSSLARLGSLPVHTIKIDRSFVSGLPDDRTARTLVTAILHLADGFGLDVIAEGVETDSQRDYLRELGCRHAQGFLFSPPVEASAITSWPRRPSTATSTAAG
jgi:EAL domain-containing protein (putative c-di-GMP-specific phosphodiesterase class I)